MNKWFKFIISKLQYDSLPQLLLNAGKFFKVHVNPYYVYQEFIDASIENEPGTEYSEITIRDLKEKDLPEILAFPDRLDSMERLQNRLNRGDLCIGAWYRDRLIAFSWANVTSFEFLSSKFALFEDEAYLYDAFTAKAFRGKRLAYILRSELYKVLKKKGINKLYSVSLKYNASAIRFKNNIKATSIGSGIQVDVFNKWKFVRLSEFEEKHML